MSSREGELHVLLLTIAYDLGWRNYCSLRNFRTFDRDYSLDLIRLVTHFVNLYSGLIVPPTLNSIITAWFRI